MTRKNRLLFVSFISFLLLLVFSSFAPTSAQKEGGIIRYPITSEPRPIDGQQWFFDRNVNVVGQHIYEGLIAVDKNLNFLPALAISWEMAPDYKSCVFSLRKGVTFHDGTSFDAKAVEANFNRIANDKPNSHRIVQEWFRSLDILDDYTIRINLTKSYTPFLTEMLQSYTRMISPASIKKYGEKLGQYPTGTGPFKFVEWVPGDRIVLTKNTDYWKGMPHLDRIIFKFTPDMTARMMGFESISFDLLDQPQYADIDRLSKSKKYEARFQVSSEMFHVVYNCAGDLFNQKNLRQAVAYAINKDLIVKSLLGENVVIAHGFGPIYLTDTLMKKDAYPYDPEKAKEILKSLGWKTGADGILVKDGKRFQFKILTPLGRYPMDKQIAEALQANVKQVGIDASLEAVESAAFIKWLRATREELAASGVGLIIRTRPLGGSLDWALTQHYHSKYLPPEGNNSGYFSNKDLDDLLMKAVSIVDEKERREDYRKAQEILFDDLPAIPIYYYRNFMFNHPYVKNIDLFTPLATPSPFISHETWMDK